ncbi:MAG TPA: hypothetical protein VGF46_05905 [Gaiellales bacterium]
MPDARSAPRIARSFASLLHGDETIEVALTGMYGTLSNGDYGTAGFSAAGVTDPFDVALTGTRMLAVQRQIYRRRGPTVSLECPRGFAHVGDLKRHALFDRLLLVFKDETLGLTVSRRSRDAVDRLVRALPEAT